MNVPLFGGSKVSLEERRPTLSEIALASAALVEIGGAGGPGLRDLLRPSPSRRL
jgi:hypothetical protein